MHVASNECGLKWLWSQMNVVSNECGLKWLWSQMNVVSNEYGLKWTGLKWTGLKWIWSQINVVSNVSYECVLKWTGLKWTGLKCRGLKRMWSHLKWSQMNSLKWIGLNFLHTETDLFFIVDYINLAFSACWHLSHHCSSHVFRIVLHMHAWLRQHSSFFFKPRIRSLNQTFL